MTEIRSAWVQHWVVEGDIVEGTQTFDIIYFVCAELVDGRTLVHDVSFICERDRAEYLAERVEAAGHINEEYWYFHDFFSRSLEERLAQEFYYEDAHRRGQQDSVVYNPYYFEGHA